MRPSNYMTRALKAHDRRFALVLGKLGYVSPEFLRAPVVETEPEPEIAPKKRGRKPRAENVEIESVEDAADDTEE